MPASIAHMLISRKVREELAAIPSYAEFSKDLQENQLYMNLGALGPDLPYYESILKAGLKMLADGSDKPMGVDQWSYQLHSKTPNIFPLKLIEIAWREANPDFTYWEEDDKQKFAFTCGFLTHMAADQIIHPLVNKVAGPYYKRGDHRKVHRQCEVYQDVVIYQQLNPGNPFLEEPFYVWCDPSRDSGDHTEVLFRYFLQKAFVEAHSIMPEEENIENWVSGIIFTLKELNEFGFYVDAAKDFSENGEASPDYKRFFGETNYEDFFKQAIELAMIYVKAAFVLYDIDHLSEDERDFFREVVQDADLSAPLEKDILNRARTRFDQGIILKA
jgi:hypothetical protein